MVAKYRWIWVALFICLALLIGLLATFWNVALVSHYRQMLELTHSARDPWIGLTLGTLSFVAVLSGIVLIFVRLFREMRLNQLQSDFLAAITHELKTPLSAIELTSTLLRAGGLADGESDRLWSAHAAELGRLRRDVDALLEAARRQVPIRTQSRPVVIETWIQDSLERWRRILGPGADLVRSGEPLNCTAMLDIQSLDLVASNLMDNARKFAIEAPRVEIQTACIPSSWPGGNRRWQIRIKDQGLGFNPAESRKIFGRFFRATLTTRRTIPGTGLGLFLAASASASMGITLRAESQGPGKGAVFTLEGRVRE